MRKLSALATAAALIASTVLSTAPGAVAAMPSAPEPTRVTPVRSAVPGGGEITYRRQVDDLSQFDSPQIDIIVLTNSYQVPAGQELAPRDYF